MSYKIFLLNQVALSVYTAKVKKCTNNIIIAWIYIASSQEKDNEVV